MAFYLISFFIAAFFAYFAVSCRIASASVKRFTNYRSALVSLYVRRANLMPLLLNAARKSSPVPQDIYGRFVSARNRFADAEEDRDIREANLDLDSVFNDFFVYYNACRDPRYIKRKEEYDVLDEKISFTKKFYEEAAANLQRINNGPAGPAIRLSGAVRQVAKPALSAFTNIFKDIKNALRKPHI